ncbi:VOC family protein [Carboxylicivirga sp. N1Y90]|uniref:VOC family protein n=1 Tax=Carboxylicivirga fragile TaxID=3417571 RepID=UPI003D334992|nr:VOC family protein [Marinilabiliaceae bacterium N1Y90]
MKIHHIAIWVRDIEKAKEFYEKYFNASCGEKYVNEKKHFTSYFLTFKGEGTKLELMHNPDIIEDVEQKAYSIGLTHMAFSVGGKSLVDELTETLRADGYRIVGEPRTTGDGFYESVVEDTEGNRIEITE